MHNSGGWSVCVARQTCAEKARVGSGTAGGCAGAAALAVLLVGGRGWLSGTLLPCRY